MGKKEKKKKDGVRGRGDRRRVLGRGRGREGSKKRCPEFEEQRIRKEMNKN